MFIKKFGVFKIPIKVKKQESIIIYCFRPCTTQQPDLLARYPTADHKVQN